MHPDLEHLIHLQELDLAAERYRRRETDIPALQSALDARLAARTAAVDAVKARIAGSQTARREVERDLAAVQSRLSKFKNQLMEVKTNKEYQAMQKEMSVAEQEISDFETRLLERMEISDFETRLLERMEEADVLAVELKTAQAALASEQAEITRERRALEQERGNVANDLKNVSEDRARTAALVSAQALALFERVAQGRRGVAMAEARDGLCTVCHVRLRPQVFNEARRNASIVQCDSCTRILYFVPAIPAAAAPPQ